MLQLLVMSAIKYLSALSDVIIFALLLVVDACLNSVDPDFLIYLFVNNRLNFLPFTDIIHGHEINIKTCIRKIAAVFCSHVNR